MLAKESERERKRKNSRRECRYKSVDKRRRREKRRRRGGRREEAKVRRKRRAGRRFIEDPLPPLQSRWIPFSRRWARSIW